MQYAQGEPCQEKMSTVTHWRAEGLKHAPVSEIVSGTASGARLHPDAESVRVPYKGRKAD